MRRLTAILLGASIFAATSMVVVGVQAQSKGKTRPLTSHQLMEGLVGPTFTSLGKELNAPPADNKAWKSVSTKAALLNECGYMMMEDGRCPDAVWAEACKKLREGSATLLEKAAAQDVEGSKQALAVMVESCKGCHGVHKKK